MVPTLKQVDDIQDLVILIAISLRRRYHSENLHWRERKKRKMVGISGINQQAKAYAAMAPRNVRFGNAAASLPQLENDVVTHLIEAQTGMHLATAALGEPYREDGRRNRAVADLMHGIASCFEANNGIQNPVLNQLGAAIRQRAAELKG
jgi:hypothetical protein